MSNNSNLLEKLKAQVAESIYFSKRSKLNAKKITAYIKGDQLPHDVKALLDEREQPYMWENILKKIDSKIAGLKISSKQSIQAFGRQKEDGLQANLFTNILRTTQDSTQWWANKKRADYDLRSSAVSIVEVVVKNTGDIDNLGKKQKEIRYLHIPTIQAHTDPFAINPDYSDMRYFHRERMLDIEDLYKYFEKSKVDKLQSFTKDTSNEYDNKQQSQYSKRAKIYYSWYKEYSHKDKRDIIKYAIWCGDTILEAKNSPYFLTRFPISIRRMDEIDYDNPSDTRGMYYDLIPIQDRINNCHLRAIHMMGTNKLLFETSAVDDAETFIEQYSLDSAVVEVNDNALSTGKIQDIKQFNEIVQLKNEVMDLRRQAEEIIGLNSEVLGSAVNRMSGSAIENRQNAGLVGLQQFIDTSAEQDKDLAQIALSLIQQYFKAEQVYRITEKDEADAYFVANEIQRDSNGIVKQNGKPKLKNSLSIGRYDIILRQMPHNRGSIADRQRVWGEMMKTMQVSHPHLLPQMVELSLEDTQSPVANKMRAIIEQDKQNQASNAHQQQQVQMQRMELEMQKIEALISEINSKANLNNSKSGDKSIVN